jgi:hypothetical protein
MSFERNESGPDLIKVTVFITLFLVVVVIFQIWLPRAATESIASIPLSNENAVDSLAAAGDSPCKLKLTTIEEPDEASNPFAYAAMWVPVRKAKRWIKYQETGNYILLHTPKGKKQIKVSADDVDLQFLPILPYDERSQDHNLVPESFYPYLHRDFVIHPIGPIYHIKGLKPSQSVTVVGRLEKRDDDIWLKPFTSAGGVHPVIITSLSPPDLTRYLHANYPIGKALGQTLGMYTDVATEPSMVGVPADTK